MCGQAAVRVTSRTNSLKPTFTISIRSLSTSALALAVTFPAVPVGALPPAVVPLPVTPPVALVATPGLEAMAEPEDSFCNKPKLSTFITAEGDPLCLVGSSLGSSPNTIT